MSDRLLHIPPIPALASLSELRQWCEQARRLMVQFAATKAALEEDTMGLLAIQSSGNTTATPLAAGVTFTGEAELNGYADVLITVKSDVGGTLYAEFSPDGTNWDSQLVFTSTASVFEVHKLVKGYRYFRVVYVNGSADQSYLRLHVSYGSFSILTTPGNLTVGTDNDTLLTRSKDYRLERAQGRYTGISSVAKFGANVDVGATEEDIVSLGGTINWLEAATTVRIKAGGNAADTAAGAGAQSVWVEGVDDNWQLASEEIATAGASASSATTTSFFRVFRAYVGDAGGYHVANTGAIVIENSAGGTDIIQIEAGRGQTRDAVYTIPAGKTGYLHKWRFSSGNSKVSNGFLNFVQNADDVSSPFSPKRLIDSVVNVTGEIVHEYDNLIVLPEKTDVWVSATTTGGGGPIDSSFEIELVDN